MIPSLELILRAVKANFALKDYTFIVEPEEIRFITLDLEFEDDERFADLLFLYIAGQHYDQDTIENEMGLTTSQFRGLKRIMSEPNTFNIRLNNKLQLCLNYIRLHSNN